MASAYWTIGGVWILRPLGIQQLLGCIREGCLCSLQLTFTDPKHAIKHNKHIMVLLRHGQTVAPHVSCVCLFGMSLARQLILRIEAWHGVFGEKQPFKSSCNLQVFYRAEVCSVGCFPTWHQPVLGIAGSVTELKWRLGMWNWETFTANKESQALEYWEPWGFLSTRSHDDCCNCNRDTKSINCSMYKVCTNMWDASMKYGPTSWNTKALANDGWCFCSNEVPSG